MLFAHRFNHGEDCGYSVVLSQLEDPFWATTLYRDDEVETAVVTDAMLVGFAEQYIKDNTNEGFLTEFISRELLIKRLISVATCAPDFTTASEKEFLIDARLYVEEHWNELTVEVAA